MGDIKRKELKMVCKRIHKTRARMVAVRMVLVLDTADTAPEWRAAEGCKPTQVCPDCVAFLGSAVSEGPSCIVLAAVRHRFGSPARRQAGRFCDMDGTVPEKESLARRGRKSLISLRTGARKCIM